MSVRNTPLHNAWCNMKARCKGRHKGSESYPERGIGYDPKWDSFHEFYLDMASSWKSGLTLDRIDNDKGYSKDNCRWTTRRQQQRNTTISKLTLEQAKEIRAIYGTGDFTHKQIADEFKVKPHNVADVTRNR